DRSDGAVASDEQLAEGAGKIGAAPLADVERRQVGGTAGSGVVQHDADRSERSGAWGYPVVAYGDARVAESGDDADGVDGPPVVAVGAGCTLTPLTGWCGATLRSRARWGRPRTRRSGSGRGSRGRRGRRRGGSCRRPCLAARASGRRGR